MVEDQNEMIMGLKGAKPLILAGVLFVEGLSAM